MLKKTILFRQWCIKTEIINGTILIFAIKLPPRFYFTDTSVNEIYDNWEN
jgi:hypothetical protein